MRTLKTSSLKATLATLLALTGSLAAAQTAPTDTRERPTVWAGLGLETILPVVQLSVSAPVGQAG